MNDRDRPTTAFTGEAATAPEVDELAAFYEYLAVAEFDGYCDLYARIAREMMIDREVLELIVTLAPATKVLPVLVNAAMHYLTLVEPDLELAAIYRGAPGDPWPPFRRLLVERIEEVRDLTTRRTIQTNEVARSSVLLAAFTAAQRRVDRPLALIEVGPSAGLNLLFDRYGHDFGDRMTAGDPASAVQLRCERRGPLVPPIAPDPLDISSRVGIDLEPVDVFDAEDCRWLEACLWPLVPDRAARLRAAISIARQDPPEMQRGGALELLPRALAAVPRDAVPCVVTTWVLAYFSKEERAQFSEVLDDVGRERDLAAVSCEYPSVAPWIPRPEREPVGNDGQAASMLGLSVWLEGVRDDRAVAWSHAHGVWIDWVDAASAGPVGPVVGRT